VQVFIWPKEEWGTAKCDLDKFRQKYQLWCGSTQISNMALKVLYNQFSLAENMSKKIDRIFSMLSHGKLPKWLQRGCTCHQTPFSLLTESRKGTLATVVTVMIIKYAPYIKYGHYQNITSSYLSKVILRFHQICLAS